jgi:electron transfer flavoprotein beta subunit
MKILVAIKRVPDFKTILRLKPDRSDVDKTHVKGVINPFDEIAIEEAIRIKEQKLADEIIVVSIGDDNIQENLRTALAMGADRAILVKTNTEVQPLGAAKILQKMVAQENPTLVILGKQAVDTDNNQVGQMLAGLLNWPQATFASKIEFHDKGVSVTREIDGGLETLLLTLPAVITTDLRLNEPRYISLPNIVQAKRKPMTTIAADSLGIDFSPRLKMLEAAIPEKKRAGIKVENVSDLVSRLKNEAQVI